MSVDFHRYILDASQHKLHIHTGVVQVYVSLSLLNSIACTDLSRIDIYIEGMRNLSCDLIPLGATILVAKANNLQWFSGYGLYLEDHKSSLLWDFTSFLLMRIIIWLYYITCRHRMTFFLPYPFINLSTFNNSPRIDEKGLYVDIGLAHPVSC